MTFFVFSLLFVGLESAFQDWDDARLEREVNRFRMEAGFVQTIEANLVGYFIDMTGKQRHELFETRIRFRAKADSIIAQSGASLTEKHEQLIKLRDQQDSELKKLLVPEQLKRLEFFDRYVRILNQGFANSLVNGDLVSVLDLSDSERIEANRVAVKMTAEYRQVSILAQKKAISRIRKSLPEERRRKFDELFEPLLDTDGTFWDVDTSMLETAHKLYLGRPNPPRHISEINGNK